MIQFPKLLYAHRGACLKLPENTLAAFEKGLEDGANALELDVHRTKDNVIVVFHDEDGQRVAEEAGKIKENSYAQIQSWNLKSHKVPTLRMVLEQYPDIPINVDIKDCDEKTAQLVVELVRQLQASHRVCLTGAKRKITKHIKDSGYDGPVGMSASEIACIYFLPEAFVGRRFEGRAAQVPIGHGRIQFATRRFIEKCHRLGIRVDFWVINDAKTAEHLLQLGADGIMSDDPGSIQFVFASQI